MELKRNKLIELLSRRKGTQFVGVTYSTDARVRAACPFKNVTKRLKVSCETGFNYKDALNKRLALIGKDPNATLFKRTWGTRIEATPNFIEHVAKDGISRTYLESMIIKVVESHYYSDGKEIKYKDVQPYLPNRDTSLVKMSVLDLNKIEEVRVNGEEYTIV